MWFKFPKGTESVQVELQTFTAEATDSTGRTYFRAPEHFAPMITMVTGFEISDPPEGTELADLPAVDPERDHTIGDQARKIQALERDLMATRTDLVAASAELSTLKFGRDKLKNENYNLTNDLEAAQEKIQDLQEELDMKKQTSVKGPTK